MAKRLIITCMKNEGPFILEWVAHHLAIGFDHFLVFTNDCDDGTVALLDALAAEGIVTRLDNPYQTMGSGYNPQKGALRYAQDLELVRASDWILISDVDEFVNVHAGRGDLEALFSAVPEARMISMQWRLFGHAGRLRYEDVLMTEAHRLCAPRFCPSPIQAWGIKTLFRTGGPGIAGAYGKFGVHRPLRKRPDAAVDWVNGSGQPVPEDYHDKGWRFGTRDHGYDLVTLNHYAVRSAESFLVKRDRGRVNHIEQDQGLAYWLRMNFNMEQDLSVQRRVPETRRVLEELRALPGVQEGHDRCVAAHRDKIAALMQRPDMRAFFEEISSRKLDLLSRHLNFLTRQQFIDGPRAVPDTLTCRLERLPVL